MTRGVVTQPNRGWRRGRKRGDFGNRNGPTKWLEWSGGGRAASAHQALRGRNRKERPPGRLYRGSKPARAGAAAPAIRWRATGKNPTTSTRRILAHAAGSPH